MLVNVLKFILCIRQIEFLHFTYSSASFFSRRKGRISRPNRTVTSQYQFNREINFTIHLNNYCFRKINCMKLFLKQRIAAQMGVMFLSKLERVFFQPYTICQCPSRFPSLTFKQFKCGKSLGEGESQVFP